MSRRLRTLIAGATLVAAPLLVAAPAASAAPLPGGPYTYAAEHSGKCLDVEHGSKDNGAPVIQWTCHGGTNQGWFNDKLDDNSIVFTNLNSGKCLDVLGESKANEARVVQQTCNGRDSQRWFSIHHGSGVYSFQNKNSQKCLTVRGGGSDGAAIVQADCDLANNQRWH
ncbi:RICIN domain-containing protein [Streptoalloteichus hindustanus]|uniref:Ricin-type beta-trefoil lectin domain-containing protein n=1 Tax=Streptoalloteichus hindustanus TaxID=2017 RepID=A0A1M4YNQ1_STRHI|nr:RICIN domain-containing protein [Streptoalloteichus hindustanus]SHF07267.1 Ricin-type beta-trefoil lectin domain-containing protein [Streptoalloteichus hindustanus]